MNSAIITIVTILIGLIVVLFLTDVIIFEISRNRAIKMNNSAYFLTLDKPFNYTRTGSIAFICALVFIFTGSNSFTVGWLLQLIIFIAIGIVSDAVVQYLLLIYARFRCKKEIENAKYINSELEALKNDGSDDFGYEFSFPMYDEISIAKNYIKPTDHLAFLSIDKGEFVKKFNVFTEATFDIEPYFETRDVEENLGDLPVRVTKLTENNQMPFKDEKIDVLMNEYSNYDKNEVTRVLKSGGYFIVNQNGTENLKEFISMYMPLGLSGNWNKDACVNSLEQAGYTVQEAHDDYGYIRFRNIKQLRTYFKKAAPEVSTDMNRFINFYTKALKEIKEKGFFSITTYRFLVVARRK